MPTTTFRYVCEMEPQYQTMRVWLCFIIRVQFKHIIAKVAAVAAAKTTTPTATTRATRATTPLQKPIDDSLKMKKCNNGENSLTYEPNMKASFSHYSIHSCIRFDCAALCFALQRIAFIHVVFNTKLFTKLVNYWQKLNEKREDTNEYGTKNEEEEGEKSGETQFN